MRVVVQLVKESSVKVNGVIKGEIENGILVLIGITHNDTESDANIDAESEKGSEIIDANIVNEKGSEKQGDVGSKKILTRNTTKSNKNNSKTPRKSTGKIVTAQQPTSNSNSDSESDSDSDNDSDSDSGKNIIGISTQTSGNKKIQTIYYFTDQGEIVSEEKPLQ